MHRLWSVQGMDRKIPWARGVCLFLYYERPKSSHNLLTKCKGYFSCTQLLFLLQPGNQVSCLAEGILTVEGFKVTSTIGWKSVDFYLWELFSTSFWVNVAVTYLRLMFSDEFNAIWENNFSWEPFHLYPNCDSQARWESPSQWDWSELQEQFRQDGFAMCGQKTLCRECAQGNAMSKECP